MGGLEGFFDLRSKTDRKDRRPVRADVECFTGPEHHMLDFWQFLVHHALAHESADNRAETLRGLDEAR